VVEQTAAIPVATLKAGYQFKLGSSMPRNTQRYIRLAVIKAATITAGKISAYLNFDN
jgi:hypothetical protein